MNQYTFIIFLLLCSLSCNVTNCISKEGFISSYTSFVDEVERARMDKKKLDIYDERYKDFIERCYPKYKEDLSIEDKKTFWKKTLKFYYNRYNGSFSDAYAHMKKDVTEEFKKDFEETMANADEELKTFFADLFKEDIKLKIDDILEGINKWGEKLKETIEEMDKK